MRLISVTTALRRHRRLVLLAATVFALALGAMTVHAATMSGADHMGDVAGICLLVGAAVAVTGTAMVLRRHRPTGFSPVALLVAPGAPAVAPRRLFLERAGPPSLLQVFRL